MPQLIKVCEQCGDEYVANEFSPGQQKYCKRTCKDKAAFRREMDSGIPRKKKGGYPRTVYVTKFMQARQSDQTAPCHYCGKRLEPDGDWVLDHMIPVSKLEIGSERNPDNLILSCRPCNVEKSTQDYSIFQAKKQKENNG